MLPLILIIAGVVVAVPIAIAATKPNSFRIERRATIKASPEKIFPLINDFRNWSSWSPWEKLDPNLTRTHSGALMGKGAIYDWEGNNKVGKGRMEIINANPNSQVTIKLDFIKPWEASNTTVFTLQPSGNDTTVVWDMTGANPFMMKVMSVFKSMDSLIGSDFEKGLAEMKRVAEA